MLFELLSNFANRLDRRLLGFKTIDFVTLFSDLSFVSSTEGLHTRFLLNTKEKGGEIELIATKSPSFSLVGLKKE